jgi:hypothetical protein
MTSIQLFLNIALTRIQLGVQEQYSLHYLQKQRNAFQLKYSIVVNLENIVNEKKTRNIGQNFVVLKFRRGWLCYPTYRLSRYTEETSFSLAHKNCSRLPPTSRLPLKHSQSQKSRIYFFQRLVFDLVSRKRGGGGGGGNRLICRVWYGTRTKRIFQPNRRPNRNEIRLLLPLTP